jgi:hypothetical protein
VGWGGVGWGWGGVGGGEGGVVVGCRVGMAWRGGGVGRRWRWRRGGRRWLGWGGVVVVVYLVCVWGGGGQHGIEWNHLAHPDDKLPIWCACIEHASEVGEAGVEPP